MPTASALVLASIRDISESQRARQALVRARYDALAARVGQLALESRDGESVIQSLPALVAEALRVDAVAVAMLQPETAGSRRARIGRAGSGTTRRSIVSATPRTIPYRARCEAAFRWSIDDLEHDPWREDTDPVTRWQAAASR